MKSDVYDKSLVMQSVAAIRNRKAEELDDTDDTDKNVETGAIDNAVDELDVTKETNEIADTNVNDDTNDNDVSADTDSNDDTGSDEDTLVTATNTDVSNKQDIGVYTEAEIENVYIDKPVPDDYIAQMIVDNLQSAVGVQYKSTLFDGLTETIKQAKVIEEVKAHLYDIVVKAIIDGKGITEIKEIVGVE